MEGQGFLLFVAPDAQTKLVSRFLLRGPTLGAARGIRIIPAQDFVTDFEPAFFGGGARFDAGHRPGTVGLALKGETQRGPNAFGFAKFETGVGEEFVVRQRRSSADVLRKEVLERAVDELFGGETNIEAVAVIPAGFRKILIHGAHEVVETALIVGAVAQENIEKDSEDLALRVVGDAALRLIVDSVFLKPSVEARLFGALPALGGTNLEFADLRAQIAVEILLVQETGAHQGVRAVSARDAFGEPKRTGVHFAGVVERLERSGPDPFDIPEVKKLVGGNIRKIVEGLDIDGRGIGVLHATAPAGSGFADVEEEGVLVVGRAFHELEFVRTDFAESSFDVVFLVVVTVNDNADRRREIVDGELFEMRGFDRSVAEGVVVRCLHVVSNRSR